MAQVTRVETKRMCTEIRSILFSVALICVAAATADSRTWTDRTGQQLDAEFINFTNGKVQIKRTSDGKTFYVPLERFSDADQAFVQSEMQTREGIIMTPKDVMERARAKSHPVFLQKRIDLRGISRSAFGIAIDTSQFADANLAVRWGDVLRQIELNVKAGRKTKCISRVTQKERGSSEFVTVMLLSEMQVKDGIALGSLLEEIRKQFGVAPPLELSLWLDPGDNVYVDVIGGQRDSLGSGGKPETLDENKTPDNAGDIMELSGNAGDINSINFMRSTVMDNWVAFQERYPGAKAKMQSANREWIIGLSDKSKMDDTLLSLAQLEHTKFSTMTEENFDQYFENLCRSDPGIMSYAGTTTMTLVDGSKHKLQIQGSGLDDEDNVPKPTLSTKSRKLAEQLTGEKWVDQDHAVVNHRFALLGETIPVETSFLYTRRSDRRLETSCELTMPRQKKN